jgi:hypothetical protein
MDKEATNRREREREREGIEAGVVRWRGREAMMERHGHRSNKSNEL